MTAATSLAFTLVNPNPAAPVHQVGPASSTRTVEPPPLTAEHRYRLIGHVRLLLFWVGNGDVGGARVTWRTDGEARVIALLVGSDPKRAPRGANAWGYIREVDAGDSARVFGVRTEENPRSPEQAEATMGAGLLEFGALCSTVTATVDRTTTTSVRTGRDVSYRDFARVLDLVAESTRWTSRDVARPAGAAAGFLTALQHLLQASVNAQTSRTEPPIPPIAYVYKGGAYDLRLRATHRTGPVRIGSEVVSDLLRGDFTVRNHGTGASANFTVTYGTTGSLAAVPVRAAYQPRWWLKLELILDEDADVPPDPAGDPVELARIRDVCDAHGPATH